MEDKADKASWGQIRKSLLSMWNLGFLSFKLELIDERPS